MKIIPENEESRCALRKQMLAQLKASSPCSTADVPGRDYDAGRQQISRRLIMRGYSGHVVGGNIVCGNTYQLSMMKKLMQTLVRRNSCNSFHGETTLRK
jgi:hypothetical protein